MRLKLCYRYRGPIVYLANPLAPDVVHFDLAVSHESDLQDPVPHHVDLMLDRPENGAHVVFDLAELAAARRCGDQRVPANWGV